MVRSYENDPYTQSERVITLSITLSDRDQERE